MMHASCQDTIISEGGEQAACEEMQDLDQIQEEGSGGPVAGGVVVHKKEGNVMAKQLATTFGAPEVTF
jgi:hypothetical protein